MHKTESFLVFLFVCVVVMSMGAQPATNPGKGLFCRALGDSLTYGFLDRATGTMMNYPADLQTLGKCSGVSNDGVSGQTSTQIAVRAGALPTTATIAGGMIPATGAVGVTFKPGYEPVTSYTMVGVPLVISGVAGMGTHTGGLSYFTRSSPGAPVSSPPDSPVSVVTGTLNDAFVIIWAGKNNFTQPAKVISDVAAIVAVLPQPKRFVVLSITNSDVPNTLAGGLLYKGNLALNASLAAAYPNNYLDIRTLLVNAYNPTLPEDVIDKNHDVLPASLRLFTNSKLRSSVPDTTSCTAIPALKNQASTVQIDGEKVWVSDANGGFATACIRGYANTSAATHAAGAPVITIDPTHLNAAGQEFVARQIDHWMGCSLSKSSTAGCR